MFCYMGDILGAGDVEEAARAKERCAWAEFKELSSILKACGTSFRINGKIYRACVDIWDWNMAMKDENLHSLKRAERMVGRWMWGVLSKDRKQSADLYSLLGIQNFWL